MITRNALYTFVESLIAASGPSDALYEAASFRNLRGSVDSEQKVVRVEVLKGEHNVANVDGDKYKEQNIEATIQFWVTPDDTEQDALDAAADLSFDMSRQVFDAVSEDPNLGGLVCDAAFREFETGDASLGTIRRGVTYLDGIINTATY